MTTSSSLPLRHPAIIAVILGGLLYIGGQYVSTLPAKHPPQQIQIQGTGKVKAVPNLAQLTFGVTIEPQASAEVATAQLAEKLTAVMTVLADLGIAKEDIKTTGLSTEPVYDFLTGRQVLRGYRASEQLEVTVRASDMAGEVVTRVTQEGVNQVGTVQFTFEDNATLVAQAEVKAIEEAKKRADNLEQALGVTFGEITYYSSSVDQPQPPFMPLTAEARDSDQKTLPISAGTDEVSVTAYLTYNLN